MSRDRSDLDLIALLEIRALPLAIRASNLVAELVDLVEWNVERVLFTRVVQTTVLAVMITVRVHIVSKISEREKILTVRSRPPYSSRR